MPGTYSSSWLARALHRYPHVDWSFHSFPNEFRPQDELYQQSLVVWAAVPLVLLLLLLLTLFVYYCYLCCASPPLRRKGPARFQWTTGLLAFFCWCCIALGIMGNQETHRGWQHTSLSADRVSASLQQIHQNLGASKELLDQELSASMSELTAMGTAQSNTSFTDDWSDRILQWKRQTYVMLTHISSIGHEFPKSKDSEVDTGVLDMHMLYRWIGSFCVYGYMLLAVAFLVVALCRNSRCLIICSSVFGVLALLVIWTFVGLHHGISVAVADLCVSPQQYIRGNTQRLWKGFNASQEFSDYYTKCDAQSVEDPFAQRLLDSSVALVLANTTTTDLVKFLKTQPLNSEQQKQVDELEELLYSQFTEVLVEWQSTSRSLDCRGLNSLYLQAVRSVCHTALNGIGLQLLASTLLGLLLFAMLMTAAVAHRHHLKRRGGLGDVDESEAFLAASASDARPENGYRRTEADYDGAETVPLRATHGASHGASHAGDDLLPNGSPPPEYNRSHEYKDSQPTQL